MATNNVLNSPQPFTLAKGGTNANLTASNGGIVYSTASAMVILAGTATAGQILRSGSSAAPSWSTATYPATAGTSGNRLVSDGTNFVSAGLASAYYTGTCTGSLSTAFNTATYPTKVTDTANAYSSGTYTVPTTGVYNISASFSITGGTITQGNPCSIRIDKNGTGIASQLGRAAIAGSNGSFTNFVAITGVSLTAGDLITVKSYTAYGTPSYSGLVDASEFMFSICQVS